MRNEVLWGIMMVLNFGLITFAHAKFGKVGLFVCIAMSGIIANIQVVKTVELFGMVATLGNIVYGTSFLATDILSECYGEKDAKKGVYIGMFSIFGMTMLMSLALVFVPHELDFAHSSLAVVFELMPRVALASFVAYFVSQRHDVWAYSFWKSKHNKTWISNNASTIVSQAIDSVVFVLIAFLGVMPTSVLFEIFITTYILKLIVAVLDTPFVYLAKRIKGQNKVEGSS